MPSLVKVVLFASMIIGTLLGATVINLQWAAYFTIPAIALVVVVFGVFPIMWAEHVYGQQQ